MDDRRRQEPYPPAHDEFLRTILDTTTDGMLVIDGQGHVRAANRRFQELWRVPDALMAAGDDAALLGHVRSQLRDPDGFMAAVQALYESDAESRDVVEFLDGRVFDRLSRPLQIDGQRGRLWSFHDVTALLERDAILRAVVSQSDSCIEVVDVESLRFVEVNDAACRTLGYTRDEYLALHVSDIELQAVGAAVEDDAPGDCFPGYDLRRYAMVKQALRPHLDGRTLQARRVKGETSHHHTDQRQQESSGNEHGDDARFTGAQHAYSASGKAHARHNLQDPDGGEDPGPERPVDDNDGVWHWRK